MAGAEWLSAPQAARLLGVQLHTVHRLIERGEPAADILPLGKRGTSRRRSIRLRRQDVDDYIERAPGEARRAAPPSPPMDMGALRVMSA